MTPLENRAREFLSDDGKCAWGRAETRKLVEDLLAKIAQHPVTFSNEYWTNKPRDV